MWPSIPFLRNAARPLYQTRTHDFFGQLKLDRKLLCGKCDQACWRFALLGLWLAWASLTGGYAAAASEPKELPSESERSILIAVSVKGTGPKVRSGRLSLQAIHIFKQLYEHENWTLRVAPGYGATALANATWRQYKLAKPGAILFGPAGSLPSQIFMQSRPNAQPNRDLFFFAQVTASSSLNRHFPTLSTFLSSEDYLRGVLPLMQQQLPAPRKVFISVREGKNVAYYRETADFLTRRVQELGLEMGGEILLQRGREAYTDEALRREGVRKNDWLLIVDHGPSKKQQMGALFESLQKAYTYGQIDDFASEPAELQRALRNSWQAVYWDHRLRYTGHGPVSSCEFTSAFAARFKTLPDFHAAFIFSSLEVADALGDRNPFAEGDSSNKIDPIATIAGTMQWNSIGRREDAAPIVFRIDAKGGAALFAPTIGVKWCEDADDVASIPITAFSPNPAGVLPDATRAKP